ncbi:MAG TPA: NADP-dependent oxidoreductase, partial [Thermoanaerobaculia bacterium]
METMKAVRVHEYGGPEVLKYENAPRPRPVAGEVLVRIHAAGV